MVALGIVASGLVGVERAAEIELRELDGRSRDVNGVKSDPLWRPYTISEPRLMTSDGVGWKSIGYAPCKHDLKYWDMSRNEALLHFYTSSVCKIPVLRVISHIFFTWKKREFKTSCFSEDLTTIRESSFIKTIGCKECNPKLGIDTQSRLFTDILHWYVKHAKNAILIDGEVIFGRWSANLDPSTTASDQGALGNLGCPPGSVGIDSGGFVCPNEISDLNEGGYREHASKQRQDAGENRRPSIGTDPEEAVALYLGACFIMGLALAAMFLPWFIRRTRSEYRRNYD